MYKSWDNPICRNKCIDIIELLKKEFFLDIKNHNIKNKNFFDLNISILFDKILADIKILKDLCRYGCIHKEVEFSLNQILVDIE